MIIFGLFFREFVVSIACSFDILVSHFLGWVVWCMWRDLVGVPGPF